MMILTIRTDKPEAEIGLFQDNKQLAYLEWQAHRQLAETIHIKIEELLKGQGKALKEVEAVAAYKGPGSFTGLRIGLSVANALAGALQKPIISETGDDWIEQSIERLKAGENEKIAMPEYGSPPHITQQKK